MSDWDFLYEMNERGYSADEIADAAGSGAAPWEWEYVDRDWINSQLADTPLADAHLVKPSMPFQRRNGFSLSTFEQANIFRNLVVYWSSNFGQFDRFFSCRFTLESIG